MTAILIQKATDVTLVLGFFNPDADGEPDTDDPKDISGWTSAEIKVKKPLGDTVTYTHDGSPAVGFYTDGTDGYAKVDIPNATIDEVSKWRAQGKVVKAGLIIRTEQGTFEVAGNL